MKLTVFFDGSFWCGLVEYWGPAQEYRVIRYVFGSEPNHETVWKFIFFTLPQLLEKNDRLCLSKPAQPTEAVSAKVNPKRMQRLLSRQKKQPAVSTKAQLALKEAREVQKKLRKQTAAGHKQLLKEQQFQLKQAKKQQKRRGH